MSTNSSENKHIVIIGAGIGGTATAARLAREGFRVTVVEKNDFSGGRCSLIHHNGHRFDQGPSLYLMPKLFETIWDMVQLKFAPEIFRLHLFGKIYDRASKYFLTKKMRMAFTFQTMYMG